VGTHRRQGTTWTGAARTTWPFSRPVRDLHQHWHE
jgi:hypothetical protein